jgi:hypothetical protein
VGGCKGREEEEEGRHLPSRWRKAHTRMTWHCIYATGKRMPTRPAWRPGAFLARFKASLIARPASRPRLSHGISMRRTSGRGTGSQMEAGTPGRGRSHTDATSLSSSSSPSAAAASIWLLRCGRATTGGTALRERWRLGSGGRRAAAPKHPKDENEKQGLELLSINSWWLGRVRASTQA